jgi:septal ring factor EnvC (AmiA/AmiB activator)
MEYVNKIVFSIVLICFCQIAFSQKNSEKLRKEQERLEKNIANTKSLLDKTKETTAASLNELKVLENQVKFREELLNNFDNQIRGAELKIDEKNIQIKELEDKLIQLKIQYKKLVIYSYKRRSKQSKLMFIFSSNTYYEAIKRNTYLKKIADLQEKQKILIRQHQGLISQEKKSLETEKERKIRLAEEKRKEREFILKDKVKQEQSVKKLMGEQDKLLAKLKEEEKNKEILKQKIKEAINKEIAAAEKARLEKEKKAAAAKAAANKASDASKTETASNEVKEVKKEISFTETKEVELNKNFEANKGRLPWPVEKGTITEGYGKHSHPTLPNVTTNNNGVDISTPKRAQVRSVFEGEVTSVFSIPGAGKVIIIKHGNYRTVYSNLQDTYVVVGAMVNTKQAIGSLIGLEEESLSVVHFEIHQVVNGQVNRMNPSLWITN